MSANPNVDLFALHEAIPRCLASVFPLTPVGKRPGWSIGFYVRSEDKINAPAIDLELTGFDPAPDGGDIGTGQLSATLRFEAYVITHFKDPKYQLFSRFAAGQLAQFLVDRTFADAAGAPIQGVSPTKFLGCYEDQLRPNEGAERYDCMRVEFSIDCLLGPDSWAGGANPSQVFLGFAPAVGSGHEDDYIQILPIPPIPTDDE